eukprot:TRINITY_DN29649_c0_g1_i1.p1 TRINITY_DN29649_c0_g1~~TRINITY_DN29649_c0_g1_i1.p1  ORF type:complete len:722 (-),score=122.73 TRINITY_DN29649_c0_g1_i1:175-2340(-)
MPVIKANVIASPKRKFRKQADDGSHSEGEGIREISRHTSKKDDVSAELRALRSSVLEEIREMGSRLRFNLKNDMEVVLKEHGALQISRWAENCGHSSQIPSCPARGVQDVYTPPRCVSAPAHVEHPNAVAGPDEHHDSPVIDAQRGTPLGQKTPSPGRRQPQDDLQEDLLDDSPAKADKNMSSSVPMAWQPAFQNGPKPPATIAARLPGEIESSSLGESDPHQDNSPDDPTQSQGSQSSGSNAKKRGHRMSVHRRQFDDQAAQFIAESLIAENETTGLKMIVSHDYFDYIMGGLILTNSLVIGVQTHMQAIDIQDRSGRVDGWQIVDITFSLLFLIELLLRILALGAHFFYMEGWAWNVFDSICVSFSVVDEATELLLAGTEAKKTIDNLSILKVLRLFRLLRLVRMVRFIPALKSMVYLIAASLQSFFWTMVLILGVMFIVAVYLTEVATELVIQGKSSKGDDIQAYWGDLFVSICTLFQAITGGDDWHNFVSVFKLADAEKYLQNLIFFVLYIAFASLVLMNLVTGVFVEGAQRIAAEEKRQDLQKQVRKIVQKNKVDINASITWDEFKTQLATKDMGVYLRAFQMDRSQAFDIFYILDDMRAGTITMKDFFSACIQLHGSVRLSDTEILRHRLMHSIVDLHDRLDLMEAQQEAMLVASRTHNYQVGPDIAKEPLSMSGMSDTSERGQYPMRHPLPPNLSGYLLRTGNNKHMVRWVLPE